MIAQIMTYDNYADSMHSSIFISLRFPVMELQLLPVDAPYLFVICRCAWSAICNELYIVSPKTSSWR